MKIKRFTAKTMRDAMRQVRDEQGPDAVILSQQRVEHGIEVVAAVDYDEALMRQAARPASGPTPAHPSTTAPLPLPMPINRDAVEMRQEMSGMRRWLEEQFGNLSWGTFERDHPLRAAAVRELERLGVESALARELMMPDSACRTEAEARRQALDRLAARLKISVAEPLQTGGVIALLGPTGAGKTTTVAKLAARYVARHGIRSVALITTDHYRVGAREQLFTYGRLLGVPVYSVNQPDELAKTLSDLAGCPLVLIDTAGLSPRDERNAAQVDLIKGARRSIRNLLVLPATAQPVDLNEICRQYAGAQPQGLVLTKVDETHRLGSALSVLARRSLPLAYIGNGQRVPEDLEIPTASKLIVEAVRQARPALPVKPSVPVFQPAGAIAAMPAAA